LSKKTASKPKVKPTSLTRRTKRKQGQSIVRTAPVRLTRAITEDGLMVNEKLLILRVGYLLALVTNLTIKALNTHWTETDFLLYLKQDQPSFAYKAWAQTFGWLSLDQRKEDRGIYLPSRVGWLALESAGRTLRSCGFRYDIYQALFKDDLTLLPPKAQGVPLRNAERAITNYQKAHNNQKPTNFFELEPHAPQVTSQLLFSASDGQIFEMDEQTFKVRLPIIEQPQSPSDWVWHYIHYKLPTHLTGVPCRPTFRINQDRHLIADLPLERKLEILETASEPIDDLTKQAQLIQKCLAFDWGSKTPLVGTCLWLDPLTGLPVSDGRPIWFKADGLIAKTHQLQKLTERLSRKLDKQSKYLGIPVETPPELVADLIQLRKPNDRLNNKRTLLWLERERVSARYHQLNDQLAHLVSRWAVEQAYARHCQVIYLEELLTLEPDLNKWQNRRFNLAVKGKIKEYITYKAQELGIKVEFIKARGTSSTCPRCGKPNKHYTDSTISKAGYAWMFCADCKLSLQRDHSGAEHIGGRGLKSKQKSNQKSNILRPTENVTRILVPAALKPDPTTLPKRGPKAKIRREQIERPIIQKQILQAGLSVDSLTTPASALSFKTDQSHRPLELRSGMAIAMQPKDIFNQGNPRPPRPLNGLRSAYLGLLKCSPLPGEYLIQNLNSEVIIG
jgi:IS605 OrfB family transposase